MKIRSLKIELIVWVFLTTVVFSILVGATVGLEAFFEAKKLQDEILIQIGEAISDDATSNSNNWSRRQKDSNIIIQPLESINSRLLGISKNQPDGLDTIEYDNRSWRIFIITRASNKRFVVAQQTEVRNDFAWDNTTSAVLSIVIMASTLLVAIPFVIWLRMKPLAKLAREVDQLSTDDINLLPDENIPSEVSPFVEAINRLLGRTRQTIDHQRRFIADASHELRTPVAALTILSENVQSATSDQNRQERLSLLHSAVKRLNSLVNQLLKLARIRDTETDDFQIVAADEVLREVVTHLYPLAEKKSIDLGVKNIEEVRLKDFHGNLGQLFENLIANAIYYSPNGSAVDVSLQMEDNKAIFQVEDQGPGIPEAELETVFTPFYRVQGNNEHGSGLGLAICAEIAEKLQGEIHLINRQETGLIARYEQAVS